MTPQDSGEGSLSVLAPDGVPEVTEGDDLVTLLLRAITPADGDIVCITSKVVSKAEGRLVTGGREESLAAETAEVVARRGATVIARTHQGATLAAAGIDASNVRAGTHLLLPRDPDASASRLRAEVQRRAGITVAVVITDTAGRPWRQGQTDIALGVAGLRPLVSYAGRSDAHGNPLVVTAPAVADEVAGAAELAAGKLAGRPFTVVRGRPDLVLAAGDDGPGAHALIRPAAEDLFGFGSREAVVRALAGEAAGFGAAAGFDDLRDAVTRLWPESTVLASGDGSAAVTGVSEAATERLRLELLCLAHGWRLDDGPHDGSRDGGDDRDGMDGVDGVAEDPSSAAIRSWRVRPRE